MGKWLPLIWTVVRRWRGFVLLLVALITPSAWAAAYLSTRDRRSAAVRPLRSRLLVRAAASYVSRPRNAAALGSRLATVPETRDYAAFVTETLGDYRIGPPLRAAVRNQTVHEILRRVSRGWTGAGVFFELMEVGSVRDTVSLALEHDATWQLIRDQLEPGLVDDLMGSRKRRTRIARALNDSAFRAALYDATRFGGWRANAWAVLQLLLKVH